MYKSFAVGGDEFCFWTVLAEEFEKLPERLGASNCLGWMLWERLSQTLIFGWTFKIGMRLTGLCFGIADHNAMHGSH
jgi:hypothetical protein